MFLSGARMLPIAEYTSSSVRGKGRLIPNRQARMKLRINPFRLSSAMAHSILSANPRDWDVLFMALSTYIGVQPLIGSHRNEIRLAPGARTKFRDFSKSSRIGELAQGVAWLYAQEGLNHPIVIDFNAYLQTQGIPPKPGSSPDFVIGASLAPRTISLLESKGSCPRTERDRLKEKLAEALDQCDAGLTHLRHHGQPSVRNKYAAALWLAEIGDPWKPVLHVADPDDEPQVQVAKPERLMRHHYATWFMLAGLREIGENLLSEQQHRLQTPAHEISIRGTAYYLFEAPQSLWTWLHVAPWIRYFGIAKAVFDVLIHRGDLKNMVDTQFEPFSWDLFEGFADGVIIFPRSPLPARWHVSADHE